MSPRLIIALAFAAIVTLGAGLSWVLIQPQAVAQSGVGAGAGVSATHPLSDAERRQYREKFFSGDPERDVRGGQEMKPRW
ncbi:entry exclusion protein TrbK [Rhizobium binae]|uniref:entry exclusion protein TrbK n=1 Tax=Rhizobium binae TaxID=1138190 RepID=UPI003DA84835